jgi:hypothetical protein
MSRTVWATASASWRGRSRRAGGTARARPAAIATRRRQHIPGPHGAQPPPAPAEEGGRVARAAQRVLGPRRSRRAAGGTHLGRTARTLSQRPGRLGKAVASRGRHRACSSRSDRDAPAVAHSWAAQRAPSASTGWGGPSCRTGGTEHARPAAIATRRLRHTHEPHGARPPPAPAEEGGCVARHRTCSSHSDRDAPALAHTWAAQPAPSASAG